MVEGIRVTDSVVLVCAVLASMASGVLLAYGVCLGMFRIFQMHAAQVEVRAEQLVAGVAQIVEG
jgi:anthranilate/para-aminobenzoate synthase component II